MEIWMIVAGALILVAFLYLCVTTRTNKIVNTIAILVGIVIPCGVLGYLLNEMIVGIDYGDAAFEYAGMTFLGIFDSIGIPIWVYIVLAVVDLFMIICLIIIPCDEYTDVYNVLGQKLGTKGGSFGLTTGTLIVTAFLMLALTSLFI